METCTPPTLTLTKKYFIAFYNVSCMFLSILAVIRLVLNEIDLSQDYWYLTAGAQVTPPSPLPSLCSIVVDESKFQGQSKQCTFYS